MAYYAGDKREVEVNAALCKSRGNQMTKKKAKPRPKSETRNPRGSRISLGYEPFQVEPKEPKPKSRPKVKDTPKDLADEQVQLESPNFVPKELLEFAKRGYVRRLRRKAK